MSRSVGHTVAIPYLNCQKGIQRMKRFRGRLNLTVLTRTFLHYDLQFPRKRSISRIFKDLLAILITRRILGGSAIQGRSTRSGDSFPRIAPIAFNGLIQSQIDRGGEFGPSLALRAPSQSVDVGFAATKFIVTAIGSGGCVATPVRRSYGFFLSKTAKNSLQCYGVWRFDSRSKLNQAKK